MSFRSFCRSVDTYKVLPNNSFIITYFVYNYSAGLISGDEGGVSILQEAENKRKGYRRKRKDGERERRKGESRKRNPDGGMEKRGTVQRRKAKNYGETERTQTTMDEKEEKLKRGKDFKKKSIKNENQIKVEQEEASEERRGREEGKHVSTQEEEKRADASKRKEKSGKVKKKTHNRTSETR